jgi:hypothetical protein
MAGENRSGVYQFVRDAHVTDVSALLNQLEARLHLPGGPEALMARRSSGKICRPYRSVRNVISARAKSQIG